MLEPLNVWYFWTKKKPVLLKKKVDKTFNNLTDLFTAHTLLVAAGKAQASLMTLTTPEFH